VIALAAIVLVGAGALPADRAGAAWNAADVRTAADALSAALSVTQADSPDPVHLGGNVTYTVQVHNDGPDDAEAVTLSDRIPNASTFQTATPSTGTCSEAAGWVTCDLGLLAADGDASVAITVRPGAAGTISNVASVSSTTDDPDDSDNAALEQTTVVDAAAALALTQSDSPDPAHVGENVTYTVQVHNDGPDDAEAVTLTDTLPGATTFQSAVPSTGTCSKTGDTVTCDFGSLAADDDASVAITVRADAAGTISNVASVSSTTDDPDDSDNTALEQTDVQPGPDNRPNIVMVITDDQPALDGRLLQFEPNVKSIFVDHGVNFTDFHSETPLCCPARAGFFTGLHTHNHKVTQNRATQFDPTETIATELSGVGYHTMLIGKYLNQYSSNTCKKPFCAPHVPPGWDKWVAFGEPNYYKYDLFIGGNYVGGDPAAVEHHDTLPEDYSTDVVASNAVSAIEAAPAGKPIFAWIAPYGPHAPSTPAPRHKNTPCNPGNWAPPNWNEADVSDKPLYVQNTALRKNPNSLKQMCRPLLAVDELVDGVRDALEREGRLDNTLFIYSGDNGMNMGEHRLVNKSAPYATQIPFLASWPDELGTTPRNVTERVQNIDFAPTICELAGCTLGPFPNGQATPDGISFLELLLGNQTTLSRDAVLDEHPRGFQTVPAWHAITTTSASPLAFEDCALAPSGGCRWHYIEYPETGERELYDVSNGPCWTWTDVSPGDPCELVNRVDDPAYADIVDALSTKLSLLKASQGQPQP
jgi:N-acetylglucosamine-6-sulfatase